MYRIPVDRDLGGTVLLQYCCILADLRPCGVYRPFSRTHLSFLIQAISDTLDHAWREKIHGKIQVGRKTRKDLAKKYQECPHFHTLMESRNC